MDERKHTSSPVLGIAISSDHATSAGVIFEHESRVPAAEGGGTCVMVSAENYVSGLDM